ncbi:IAA-alanine resistance protein 1 [Aristolochia californica]|uniref:IAA-alanine resistance protein 1 n=1 Tax=Aristolochia californica TaxID=171875 RepID=UPI0035D80EB5
MEMSVKVFILALGVLVFSLRLCHAHEAESGSCPFSSHASHDHNHHHSHRREVERSTRSKLPEEMAEEEDLELYGFSHESVGDSGVQGLSKISLWGSAMGCSLLVSMASLVCIIILPVIFSQGKPSKVVVDSLAAFGAGAMLGDAFLHQLPHAFGGGHSHSHEHHVHDGHAYHTLGHESSHAHSLEDLSVGLSVLSGIVLFLLVEKIVRYVEDHSTGGHELGHGHHHHHHKSNNKLKKGATDKSDSKSHVDGKKLDPQNNDLRKRSASGVTDADKSDPDILNSSTTEETVLAGNGPAQSQSNLVFGYLNLFSDGVHNFTDGMALGSAFLLHGSVGGWSRTLFLLAHELPQEVGDFGILVRSGFSVPKALFFNFLSALVALVGTALALLWGKDPGQSSLIEGFTAGGFIYIAAAGVLPEMNNGNTSFKSTVIQLTALLMGMGVALCISLVE